MLASLDTCNVFIGHVFQAYSTPKDCLLKLSEVFPLLKQTHMLVLELALKLCDLSSIKIHISFVVPSHLQSDCDVLVFFRGLLQRS